MAGHRLQGRRSPNPAWVHNLAEHPEATVVLAAGERVPVRAERLAGEELERAWGARARRGAGVFRLSVEDQPRHPG